jgi:myosin-crossreactive antigen
LVLDFLDPQTTLAHESSLSSLLNHRFFRNQFFYFWRALLSYRSWVIVRSFEKLVKKFLINFRLIVLKFFYDS